MGCYLCHVRVASAGSVWLTLWTDTFPAQAPTPPIPHPTYSQALLNSTRWLLTRYTPGGQKTKVTRTLLYKISSIIATSLTRPFLLDILLSS
jgi:hypothetical protein